MQYMQKDSAKLDKHHSESDPLSTYSDEAISQTAKRPARSRRINLLRMLIFPLFLTLILVLFLMIGRDRLVRNNYLEGMRELGRQIDQYQAQHKKWPTHQEVMAFTIDTRMNLQNVKYDETHILVGCPDDTLLAYTNFIQLRFLKSGLSALSVGGDVEWIDREELKRRLDARERYYNKKILH
jgi:hypothetical protein